MAPWHRGSSAATSIPMVIETSRVESSARCTLSGQSKRLWAQSEINDLINDYGNDERAYAKATWPALPAASQS